MSWNPRWGPAVLWPQPLAWENTLVRKASNIKMGLLLLINMSSEWLNAIVDSRKWRNAAVWSTYHVLNVLTAQSGLPGRDHVQDGETLDLGEARLQPPGEHQVSFFLHSRHSVYFTKPSIFYFHFVRLNCFFLLGSSFISNRPQSELAINNN